MGRVRPPSLRSAHSALMDVEEAARLQEAYIERRRLWREGWRRAEILRLEMIVEYTGSEAVAYNLRMERSSDNTEAGVRGHRDGARPDSS